MSAALDPAPPPAAVSVPEPVPVRPETGLFPSPALLVDWRQPFLVPLVVLVLTRAFFWRLLPLASEDAYITFRYARSLVVGLGLTYNPGERVMGFSSPLWTVWNAAGYALTRDPVMWSRGWSVLADAVTLLVLGELLRRHGSRASSWCFTLFFAGWTYFAALPMTGMESSATVALLVLAAALVARRSSASGFVLAALAMIRPEGAVAAGLIALWAPGRQRFVFVALVAAACATLWSWFGTIVPQSIVAKSSIYGTPGVMSGRLWWEWISPLVLGRWPVTTEGGVLFAMAVVTGPAAAIGAWSLVRSRPAALTAAVLAMTAVWAAYSVLGVAYFSWYLALPLVAAATLAALGLPRIVKGAAIYLGLAIFLVGTWTIAPGIYGARANAEYRSFAAVASYLIENSTPWQSVFLEPIGIVGWDCKLRIIDEVGLVSPHVAKRRLQGPGWMTDVVRGERPDWLVVRRGVRRDLSAFAGVGAPFRDAAERDATLAAYTLRTTIHEEAGDGALEVWARNPS